MTKKLFKVYLQLNFMYTLCLQDYLQLFTSFTSTHTFAVFSSRDQKYIRTVATYINKMHRVAIQLNKIQVHTIKNKPIEDRA